MPVDFDRAGHVGGAGYAGTTTPSTERGDRGHSGLPATPARTPPPLLADLGTPSPRDASARLDANGTIRSSRCRAMLPSRPNAPGLHGFQSAHAPVAPLPPSRPGSPAPAADDYAHFSLLEPPAHFSVPAPPPIDPAALRLRLHQLLQDEPPQQPGPARPESRLQGAPARTTQAERETRPHAPEPATPPITPQAQSHATPEPAPHAFPTQRGSSVSGIGATMNDRPVEDDSRHADQNKAAMNQMQDFQKQSMDMQFAIAFVSAENDMIKSAAQAIQEAGRKAQ